MSSVPERPQALPPQVDTIRPPERFGPSTFGDLLRCPLSAVHGLSGADALPPDPSALLGSVVHSVMHLARSEMVLSADEFPQVVEASFERELARTEDELSGSARTRRLVPLRKAVGRRRWRERKAFLRRWAATMASTMTVAAPPPAARPWAERGGTPEARNPVRTLVPTRRIVPGSERILVPPVARLSARLDSVQRDHDGTLHITDFKTGPVRGRDGGPPESYALQMRLYALAAEEVEPGARVRLWLEGAERVEVLWSEYVRSQTRETLSAIEAALPASQPVSADALAREGQHCGGCAIRHLCPRYRRVAPTWWTQRSSTRTVAPFDVWGTVLDVRTSGDHRPDGVTLLDAAGRKVRVSGLGADVDLRDVHAGQRLWFFGLQPNEVLPLHGFYVHPHNFHGRRPGKAWTDALRLQVFVEPR